MNNRHNDFMPFYLKEECLLDSIDLRIVALLIAQGRARWSDLAREVGLSAPSVMERVRRLEADGVIVGYGARVAPRELGFGVTAFVSVTLAHPRYRGAFLDFVDGEEAVVACHHVAGEGDYLLKALCRGTEELEKLLSEKIKAVEGVTATRTTVVLSTSKETVRPPRERSR